MTQDAQSALRRTMERYSRITRFCLVCNYVTRIIDPLASRCSKFRFKALDGSAAGARLEEIANVENVKLDDGVVDTLIQCSEGDLRKAITFMQSAARLIGSGLANGGGTDDGGDEEMVDADKEDVVTVRMVEEIAGVVPDGVINRLVEAMQPRKGRSAYDAISEVVTDIVADGWSATQILSQVCGYLLGSPIGCKLTASQMYQIIVFNESIPDIQKNSIVMVFSEFDKRIIDGADEHLTILDMALRISGIMAQS